MANKAPKIEEIDWKERIAVFPDKKKIYRLDTMMEISKQQTVTFDGYSYNLRRIAFYLIYNRWPKPRFLLPWE